MCEHEYKHEKDYINPIDGRKYEILVCSKCGDRNVAWVPAWTPAPEKETKKRRKRA